MFEEMKLATYSGASGSGRSVVVSGAHHTTSSHDIIAMPASALDDMIAMIKTVSNIVEPLLRSLNPADFGQISAQLRECFLKGTNFETTEDMPAMIGNPGTPQGGASRPARKHQLVVGTVPSHGKLAPTGVGVLESSSSLKAGLLRLAALLGISVPQGMTWKAKFRFLIFQVIEQEREHVCCLQVTEHVCCL